MNVKVLVSDKLHQLEDRIAYKYGGKPKLQPDSPGCVSGSASPFGPASPAVSASYDTPRTQRSGSGGFIPLSPPTSLKKKTSFSTPTRSTPTKTPKTPKTPSTPGYWQPPEPGIDYDNAVYYYPYSTHIAITDTTSPTIQAAALGIELDTFYELQQQENETRGAISAARSWTPAQHNFCTLSFRDTDKIFLMGFTTEGIHAVREALHKSWVKLQRDKEKLRGVWEFKLKGNPWQPSYDEVGAVRNLVCNVLQSLYNKGIVLVSSVNSSNCSNDKDTLYFIRTSAHRRVSNGSPTPPLSTRRYSPTQLQSTNDEVDSPTQGSTKYSLPHLLTTQSFFCMYMAETDKLCTVHNTAEVGHIMRSALQQHWVRGVQKESTEKDDKSSSATAVTKFKLRGNPWFFGPSGDGLSGCKLLCKMLQKLAQHQWYPYVVMSCHKMVNLSISSHPTPNHDSIILVNMDDVRSLRPLLLPFVADDWAHQEFFGLIAYGTNSLRLIGVPSDLREHIKHCVTENWGANEDSVLSSNTNSSSHHILVDNTVVDIQMDGDPWVGKGVNGVIRGKLMLSLFHMLLKHDYFCYCTLNVTVSINQHDKDLIVFAPCDPQPHSADTIINNPDYVPLAKPNFQMCAISLSDTDKIRLITQHTPPSTLITTIAAAVQTCGIGVTQAPSEVGGCHEFKLKCKAWTGSDQTMEDHNTSELVIQNVLDAMESQNWQLYSSVDVAHGYKGLTNAIGRKKDILIFIQIEE